MSAGEERPDGFHRSSVRTIGSPPTGALSCRGRGGMMQDLPRARRARPDRASPSGDDDVRVLVVDDHPVFRGALTAALEMVEGFEVAGEAGGGLAACSEAEQLRPDVVLMD